MKSKITTKTNKGAALVSVMIAIAFISVVATSMLMISVSNYKMKSANIMSKSNFYEAESNLVKLSTSLRNSVMSDSDPTTKIEDYIYKDSSNNMYYDVSAIGKLVYPSASGDNKNVLSVTDSNGDSIVFSSSNNKVEYTNANGIETYKLKDLSIKRDCVDTDHKEREYSNSLKTDIVIKLYASSSSTQAKGGVGDLSMLMDNNVDLTSSDLKSSVDLYGNNFIAKYNGLTSDNSYTKAATAVNMSNYAKLNFIGDYNVVYGDIVLSDNSCMVVYGNLTVFGDIYLKDSSVLICTKKIKMCDEALPWKTDKTSIHVDGTNNKIILEGASVSGTNVNNCIDYSVTKSKFDEFTSILKLNDGSTSNDGLIDKIMKPIKLGNYGTIPFTACNGDQANTVGKLANGKFYDKTLNFYVNWQDPINNEMPDSLVINLKPNAKVRESNIRSTIISAHTFKFDMNHTVVITKLGDQEFKYMTKTDPKYNNVNNGTDFAFTYKGNDNTNNNMGFSLKVSDLFESDCNLTVEKMFNSVSGGDSGDKSYQSSLAFESYEKDHE